MMAANGAGSSSSGGAGLGNPVMTALAGSSSGSNASTVPPGFRFHPTDEELLYYYLKKKVSYEAIDLDVIREVDLNKLEPWDLKDKCRIGSGPQNEWYFFSHKDKKYPTGTRTNRATAAGFWKATGRDKPIHHHSSSSNSSKRIGMRKTLVFYVGRAPHGRKTDWIMHEYRLDDQDSVNNFHHISHHHHELEDGWVVCRVFKKKNNIPANGNTSSSTSRGFQQPDHHHHDDHHQVSDMNDHEENFTGMLMKTAADHQKQNPLLPLYGYHHETAMQMQQQTMHLPQLLSPESMQQHHHHVSSSFLSAGGANIDEIGQFYGHHSQSLLSLTPGSSSVAGDWSFLDKLLASGHQNVEEMHAKTHSPLMPSHHDMVNSGQRFPLLPFQFSEPGCFKFSK